MIGKIIKYSAVICATVAATITVQNEYNKLFYEGLKPADGRPSFEKAEQLEVVFKENKGFLETYISNGQQNIPVYQRQDKILIGDIRNEIELFTPAEKQFCYGMYHQELNQEKKQMSNEKNNNIGRWIGDKLREGKGAVEEVVESVIEGYNKHDKGGSQ